MYKKYERDFENIQELIAECFMASEFTSEIKVAKKVKVILIDTRKYVTNKRLRKDSILI